MTRDASRVARRNTRAQARETRAKRESRRFYSTGFCRGRTETRNSRERLNGYSCSDTDRSKGFTPSSTDTRVLP